MVSLEQVEDGYRVLESNFYRNAQSAEASKGQAETAAGTGTAVLPGVVGMRRKDWTASAFDLVFACLLAAAAFVAARTESWEIAEKLVVGIAVQVVVEKGYQEACPRLQQM